MLNLNQTMENGKCTIMLDGRLDTVTSPDLETCLKTAMPDTKELVLDFEKLSYISSAGLRVLLSAQKVMNHQGNMKVIRVSDSVMEIFEITGFSDILNIEQAG